MDGARVTLVEGLAFPDDTDTAIFRLFLTGSATWVNPTSGIGTSNSALLYMLTVQGDPKTIHSSGIANQFGDADLNTLGISLSGQCSLCQLGDSSQSKWIC